MVEGVFFSFCFPSPFVYILRYSSDNFFRHFLSSSRQKRFLSANVFVLFRRTLLRSIIYVIDKTLFFASENQRTLSFKSTLQNSVCLRIKNQILNN